MNWLFNYQTEAHKTAIYPKEYAAAYCGLKLIGEVSELIEKYVNKVPKKLILLEIGDCLWYLAEIATLNNIVLSTLMTDLFFHPIITKDFEQQLLWLSVHAGSYNEQIGKLIRKENKVLFPEEKQTILMILGCFRILNDLSISIGSTLEQVAQENLSKLQSRFNRNVIIGNGDLR